MGLNLRSSAACLAVKISRLVLRVGPLELGRVFRSLGRVAGAIRMCARARQLAAVNDKIFVPNRSLLEPAFENLARAGGVTRLRRKRGPGNVRRHAVVGHRAPRVILRRRLREPDVSGVARELSAFERPHDRVAIADLARAVFTR